MKVLQILSILFFIQGGVYSNEDLPYCTEQRDSIRVDKGGSVTIPCHFSYPNNTQSTDVRVYWRHAKGGQCGSNEIIYRDTERWTHKSYEGRISMVGDPQRERTATIRIQELKENDGPMFCCRISIQFNRKSKEEWQTVGGTYIYFKDHIFVEQPDVVPAMLGEDISIPCVIHNWSPDNIEEIVWRFGKSDLCFENREFLRWNKQNAPENVGRWMVQKSERSFLLHIMNVTSSDIGQYCCEVNTKNKTEKRSSAYGSQVVIADHHQNVTNFTVTQCNIISANEEDSVTISCSYNDPPGPVPMWREVFWRVGSPSGPFSYHPSELMVHPSYRGRTQLSGSADLQINRVRMSDNTTYYCFVMLKFCTGVQKTISVIKYGIGIQLKLNSKITRIPIGLQIIIFGGYIGIKAFLILISIILSAIYLKKK
ncbi:sialic acid-binding Ig-like lectin 12 [Pyxicephalus adspersus]|uniref:sialic acid-binding Ig-like lectin 12 n=1 Tax=Pyxicephalus adspersus TaxID=30357 RepID=UPI003B59822D